MLRLLPFLALCCAGCANGIFFQPGRRMAPPPSERGLAFTPVQFEAADGVPLTGWWLPAEGDPRGTVVHFHGNAQNMSTHVRFADWLPAEGYHLLVFDYRGYGRSGSHPTRAGVVRDGVAALHAARSRPDFHPPLIVWGQSLGGTIALRAVLEDARGADAILVDSTFTGYGDIAAEKMRNLPWFLQPLRLIRPLFVSNGPDALDAVKRLADTPMAFLHGEDDPIVPARHSRTLRKAAPNTSPLWIIPGAGHCDAVLRFPDTVRPRLLRFFESAAPQH